MNTKKSYFHSCPDCGANLDPGEKCDCGGPVSNAQEALGVVSPSDYYFQKERSRDISETLLVGYDSSNGVDVSALSITRWSGGKMMHIKTLLGKEAEDMYDQLTSFGHCVKL